MKKVNGTELFLVEELRRDLTKNYEYLDQKFKEGYAFISDGTKFIQVYQFNEGKRLVKDLSSDQSITLVTRLRRKVKIEVEGNNELPYTSDQIEVMKSLIKYTISSGMGMLANTLIKSLKDSSLEEVRLKGGFKGVKKEIDNLSVKQDLRRGHVYKKYSIRKLVQDLKGSEIYIDSDLISRVTELKEDSKVVPGWYIVRGTLGNKSRLNLSLFLGNGRCYNLLRDGELSNPYLQVRFKNTHLRDYFKNNLKRAVDYDYGDSLLLNLTHLPILGTQDLKLAKKISPLRLLGLEFECKRCRLVLRYLRYFSQSVSTGEKISRVKGNPEYEEVMTYQVDFPGLKLGANIIQTFINIDRGKTPSNLVEKILSVSLATSQEEFFWIDRLGKTESKLRSVSLLLMGSGRIEDKDFWFTDYQEPVTGAKIEARLGKIKKRVYYGEKD